MSNPVVLDNEAVHVTRIDDASVAAGDGRPIRHRAAVLVGVKDGGGALCHREGSVDRYFPVARGRIDWLATGELRAIPTSPLFGEVMLVELRALPNAPGVSRTFGDKMLSRGDRVGSEGGAGGPGQGRPSHGPPPRLITPPGGAHARRGFPGGESREDRSPAGGAHWAPQIMVHEISNIGDAPFWAI